MLINQARRPATAPTPKPGSTIYRKLFAYGDEAVCPGHSRVLQASRPLGSGLFGCVTDGAVG